MSVLVQCSQCRRKAVRYTPKCPKCGTALREGKGLVYVLDATDGTVDASGKLRRIRFTVGRSAVHAEAVDSEIATVRYKNKTRMQAGMAAEPWIGAPIAEGKGKVATVETIRDAYLESPDFAALRAPEVKRSYLNTICNGLGLATPIANISKERLNLYADERRKAESRWGGPLANQTIIHELSAFSSAYTWCLDRGLIKQNLIQGFKRPERSAARETTLSFADYQAVKAELPPKDVSDAWAVLECRIRLPFRDWEIFALQVEDVHLDVAADKVPYVHIRAELSKSGKARDIPIWWPGLVGVLKEIIGDRTEGPLFRWRLTPDHPWKPWKKKMIGQLLQRAVTRAGVKAWQRDLRATAITLLIKHEVPMHALADASDHTNLLIQHRYVRAAEKIEWPLEGVYSPIKKQIVMSPHATAASLPQSEIEINPIVSAG